MRLPFFLADGDEAIAEFVLLANPHYSMSVHRLSLKGDGTVSFTEGVCMELCLSAEGKYRIHQIDEETAQIHFYDLTSNVVLSEDKNYENPEPFTTRVRRLRGIFALPVGAQGKIAEEVDWPHLVYDTKYVFDTDPLALGIPPKLFAGWSDGEERFSEHEFYWRDSSNELTARKLAVIFSKKNPLHKSTNPRRSTMSKVHLPETEKLLLWVNDNPSISKERIDAFTSNGVVIVAARSTKRAMELFERVAFAGVVTDLRRNENGTNNQNAGIELTQRIRRCGSKIPVFIYSINIDVATAELAKNSGATIITANPTELENSLRKHGLI